MASRSDFFKLPSTLLVCVKLSYQPLERVDVIMCALSEISEKTSLERNRVNIKCKTLI